MPVASVFSFWAKEQLDPRRDDLGKIFEQYCSNVGDGFISLKFDSIAQIENMQEPAQCTFSSFKDPADDSSEETKKEAQQVKETMQSCHKKETPHFPLVVHVHGNGNYYFMTTPMAYQKQE